MKSIGVLLLFLTVVPSIAKAQLEAELRFELTANLAEGQQIGATPVGVRQIVPVTGGEFSGPELSGEVLPGGGDWLLVRTDGVRQLDVRITLRTEDGAHIYVRYPGILDASAEVLERIVQGEEVDSSEYYFRTTPVFETGAEEYSWLNSVVAVGVGRLAPGATAVIYSVYVVK